ncbi:MAG: hypothetical protein STHCBS139747_004343 [Sporothrix thermara]
MQSTLKYYADPSDGSEPTPVVIGQGSTVTNERKVKKTPDGFRDVNLVKTAYFDDCVSLLELETGASHVVVFNHKVRRGPADWHSREAGNASQRGPLHRVHIDQSYNGAAFLG